MSTKVSYKGAQIAEVGAQQTKTLLTAGKYCEDDFTLANDDNPTAEENDVIFIDYDGTIRYSYSAEEFAALTALPPLPVHAGLTGGGWNWTLADAKAYVAKSGGHCIGYNPETTDGKTHGFIDLLEDALYVQIDISLNGTAVVDFCDGSEPVTLTGSSILNHTRRATHTYASGGKKQFTIAVTGQATLPGNSSYNESICRCGRSANSPLMTNCLVELHIGANTGIFDLSYGLTNQYRLEAISVPPNCAAKVRGIYSTGWFIDCRLLKCFVIPSGIADGDLYYTFRYATIHRVSFPNAALNLGGYFNQGGGCALSSICFPASTVIGTYALPSQLAIKQLYIPESVQTIAAYALQDMRGLGHIKFAATTPPTLASSTSLTFLDSCLLYVPFSALAAYLTGTNYPNPATYTYLGFATYTSGATLPTQDGTAAYNVTWYATKGDAIAQTNAITEGNGKEIYCRYTAVA